MRREGDLSHPRGRGLGGVLCALGLPGGSRTSRGVGRSRRARARLSIGERLEVRWVFSHTGGNLAGPTEEFVLDPALADIESSPPGPGTGPAPVTFASYTTLANGMPVLSSHPSAPTSIYLDFDGDRSLTNPYGDRTVSPYSEDADGTTFNLSEQRTIYETWRQVSAYFAMFDVEVTTVPPPASKPKAWLAVGNNISGGYSYVDVFPNAAPLSWNSSDHVRGRVSGVAHELGHNFGLQHQATYDAWGTRTAEYAAATDPLHGAILGVDFDGIVHKFILGRNSTSTGVTTLQDDVAIIAAKIQAQQPAGGDGFRADDFGNTLSVAAPLPVVGGSQWTAGILERLADVDAFSFTTTGGVYGISAAPDAPSGVDLKLEIYAADGQLMAVSDSANNVQQLTLDLAAGSYYALVSGRQNYGDLGAYFLSVSPLPTGWRVGEVGLGVTGYTVYDEAAGRFSSVGTGAGVTGTSDGFQMAYQTLRGDGSITARVANVDNTSANALVGLTMRESLAANARHVSIGSTFGNGLRQYQRGTVGSGTSVKSATAANAGHTWLRLSRAGNVFTTQTSADGISWTGLGAVTMALPESVQVGLLTASANAHSMNVGQLDNVTLTGTLGTPSFTYNSLAAPADVSLALGTGSGLDVSWSAVAGASGYVVERSSDGVGFTSVGTTAGTAYADPTLLGSQRYFYRVSALDAVGASVPSAVVSQVNRPSAVTGLRVISPSRSQLVLDWRETTGETGYLVQRSTDGGANFTTVGTVGANVNGYTDNGLLGGFTYTYRVVPTSPLGDGDVSALITGAPRLASIIPNLGPIAPGSMSLSWIDVADETGYWIERSNDGSTFTTIAEVPANSTSFTDTTVLSGREYYYRVLAFNPVTRGLTGTVKFGASASTSPPPAPWASRDIGLVRGPGSTEAVGGTFRMVSSGSSIGGTTDTFRFTSQLVNGDASLVARVSELENTGSSARAGLMIRQSNDGNAMNAFVYVTPTSIGFTYRRTTGGVTTTSATVTGAAPRWLKLTRTGSSVAAFYSSDGSAWTAIGTSIPLSLSASAELGVATTAGSTTVLNTATFTNVALTALTRPNVTIADVTRPEGQAGATAFQFTVSLSTVASEPVTLQYATTDGTATAGSDYTATTGTLTIPVGETTGTITVAVAGDAQYESNETFSVTLSNVVGGILTDGFALGTITNDDTLPLLSIADASVQEGNSGTTLVTLPVTLDAPAPAGGVTVQYATSNGTATTADGDYVATSGTLTIPPGATSGVIQVAIVGDGVFELDETLDVNLSGLVRATLADGSGRITLVNDDSPPRISVADASLVEGQAGSADLVFIVTLDSPAPAGGVSVGYATQDGTATSVDLDYQAVSGTLVIPVGATQGEIRVPVLGDPIHELDETFTLVLASPVQGELADGLAVGSIVNDDALPRISIADALVAEGDSGTAVLEFSVTLDAPAPAGGVTVEFSTLDGSATLLDDDYQAASGTVTFLPGETQGTVQVSVVGDVALEADEALQVTLANPVQATILQGSATGTILNDDTPRTISIGDATIVEGNAGTTQLVFTVSLSAAAPAGGISVDYATQDGTATVADGDYAAASGTLSFAVGQIQRTVSVDVVGDDRVELDETLQLVLTGAVNGTIQSGTSVGTIQNDDMPPAISVSDASIVEGNSGVTQLVFTVSLDAAAPASGVTVDYTTQDATATLADGDYTATAGTLVFAAGETQRTVAVDITGDDRVELDETLRLVLANAVHGTIAAGTAVGTIQNDDVLPAISVSDASIAEGNSGVTQLVFTVSLDAAAPASGLTVDYATQDATATLADGDYTATAGTLVFAAGETQRTVAVDITGDDRVELDETLRLVMTNAVNGTIAAGTAVGTIQNDDVPPAISVANASIVEGNSGVTQLVFTVSLNAAAPSSGVTVDYATQDATATLADGDYTATAGTLVFAAGETQRTVAVDITGDDRVELDETLRLVLTNAVNGTIAAGVAGGTIQNDDVLPAISVSDASIAEGNSGVTQLVFTVSLNAAAPSSGVTVNYNTANGTATIAGNDYQATSGVLTFLPGETQQVVAVAVMGDRVFEGNETLQLRLTSPVNGTLLDALGVGTIQNDDLRPAIRIADVTALEGDAGVTTLVFPVTLSTPALAGGATVRWTTADSTATLANGDYVAASGTLTFEEGTLAGEIRVDIVGDTTVEATERVSVRLSSATNATIADSLGVGNLVNDDLVVSVGDVSVVEGSTGRTKSLLFPLTLSAPAPVGGVAVTFATADGSAVAPSDYTARQATQTIAAGLTTATVSVTIQSDRVAEFDETLLLNLVRVTNAILGDSQGVATIVNDDAGTPAGAVSTGATAPAGGTSGTATPFSWFSSVLVAAALPAAITSPARSAGLAASSASAGSDAQAATSLPSGASGERLTAGWAPVGSSAVPVALASGLSASSFTAGDAPANRGTVGDRTTLEAAAFEKPLANRNAAVDAVFATL